MSYELWRPSLVTEVSVSNTSPIFLKSWLQPTATAFVSQSKRNDLRCISTTDIIYSRLASLRLRRFLCVLEPLVAAESPTHNCSKFLYQLQDTLGYTSLKLAKLDVVSVLATWYFQQMIESVKIDFLLEHLLFTRYKI